MEVCVSGMANGSWSDLAWGESDPFQKYAIDVMVDLSTNIEAMGQNKENTSGDHSPTTRRNFAGVALLLGSTILGGMGVLASFVVSLFQPLGLRKLSDTSSSGALNDPFLFITTLDLIPGDGSAAMFPVISDSKDAWTRHPSRSIGNIFLRKSPPSAEVPKVLAWNARCPHAGCTISIRKQEKDFFCFCHESRFSGDGSLPDGKSHSPRAMDSLEVEIRNQFEVWVQFQQFQVGTKDKKPVA